MTTRWDAEELAEIQDAMSERLAPYLHPGERLAVEGTSAKDQVWARFVLAPGPRGERVELEARVALDLTRVAEEAARDRVLDALDIVLLEYLDSGREQRFSGVFERRELDETAVEVRAERTFPDLDAQADALLSRAPEGEEL